MEHKFQIARNRRISIRLRNAAAQILSAIAARPSLQWLWSMVSIGSRYFQGLGSGSTIARSGELNVIDWVAKTTGIPRVFVDVGGGNLGHYSQALLNRLPDAKIHIFEPSKPLAREICKRFESNKNIVIYDLALSDRGEDKELVAVHEGAMTSTFYPHLDDNYQHSESVTCTTLDKYCELIGIDEIGLLKVDVEGHELNVLAGAERMLSSHLIHAVQFDGGAAVNSRVFFYDFWKMFQKHDYVVYRVLPNGIAPITHYREQDECCLPTIYLAKLPNTKWKS